jgi:hypothetical protein
MTIMAKGALKWLSYVQMTVSMIFSNVSYLNVKSTISWSTFSCQKYSETSRFTHKFHINLQLKKSQFMHALGEVYFKMFVSDIQKVGGFLDLHIKQLTSLSN